MLSNSILHETRPRNVAYDAENAPYYSTKTDVQTSLIKNNGNTIFAGTDQVALFLTCMALAKYKNLKPKALKKREPNIPTNAMGLSGQWLVLALGMSEKECLTCLEDEADIYKEAEKYANAGFEYLQQLIKNEGASFGEYFEDELRGIAEDFISKVHKKNQNID